MNEIWLITCLSLLAFLGFSVFYYPLRHEFSIRLALSIPLTIIALIIGYSYWGAWSKWQSFSQEQVKRKEAQTLLSKIKSPDELINKLKIRLDDTSQSARGWYLLGRLYANQNKWSEAVDAFTRAHRLNKADEAATINYANALWQLNELKFNQQILTLFNELLEKNPNQPDALAMLAMAAFQEKNYSKAEHYWQTLLKLVPPDSEEARALQKAIAKVHATM